MSKGKSRTEMEDQFPFMKGSKVSDSDLRGALNEVMYGFDSEAAFGLISYFHERMLEGGNFDERILLDFVYHAFGKIVKDGYSADQAFGLKLGRGRYVRAATIERDLIATAYMILLMRRGWKYLDAGGEAATLLFPDGAGEKAVFAAYNRYQKVLREIEDEDLIQVLPENTPIISRNMVG